MWGKQPCTTYPAVNVAVRQQNLICKHRYTPRSAARPQTAAPSRSRTFVCLMEKALVQLRVPHLLPAHGNTEWKPRSTRGRAKTKPLKLPSQTAFHRQVSPPGFPAVTLRFHTWRWEEGKVRKAKRERNQRRSGLHRGSRPLPRGSTETKPHVNFLTAGKLHSH